MTLSVPRSKGLVPARFLTPRDPARRTMGPAVARVMHALGKPPMPHQQYITDVGGEVDDRGRFVHSLCVVTLQRQGGKTEIKQGQAVQRALQGPNRRCWDTAQTGQDARDKHRDLADAVLASPLRDLVATRRQAAGSEGLVFTNGSTLRPHPPTRDALHGRQSDHNDIDEGWSFDPVRGAELLQAIIPTQATRPGAQTWVWSTRGDQQSEWFDGLIAMGYAGVPGVALFDFGIPDDADPADLDVVARYHPAYGYTIGDEALRAAQAALPPGEFARAYGNRSTGARERVIPEAAWAAARTTSDLPAGRPAYGVAVWEPRDGGDVSGALVAATADQDGRPVLEVIEHRPGRAWLVDTVLSLIDRGPVAVARRGPAGPVADALELAGVELLDLAGTAEAAADQDLWDRLCDEAARAAGPRLLHRADPRLDDAADVAGRRFIGEGAWVFSARQSTGDISCLKAAAAAARALAHGPAPVVVGRAMFLPG